MFQDASCHDIQCWIFVCCHRKRFARRARFWEVYTRRRSSGLGRRRMSRVTLRHFAEAEAEESLLHPDSRLPYRAAARFSCSNIIFIFFRAAAHDTSSHPVHLLYPITTRSHCQATRDRASCWRFDLFGFSSVVNGRVVRLCFAR